VRRSRLASLDVLHESQRMRSPPPSALLLRGHPWHGPRLCTCSPAHVHALTSAHSGCTAEARLREYRRSNTLTCAADNNQETRETHPRFPVVPCRPSAHPNMMTSSLTAAKKAVTFQSRRTNERTCKFTQSSFQREKGRVKGCRANRLLVRQSIQAFARGTSQAISAY
jgi:hypothetical protein